VLLNGLDFHVEIDGAGPPLLLLHGFTGGARAWDDLRPRLTDLASVISIDVIGHARSAAPADAARYSMPHAARDLVALLDALRLPTASVLGYSMGGRLALYFAVHHPGRVASLILESASPGLADAQERADRVFSDEALADSIERQGLASFVERWERQPLLEPAPHVSQAVRAEQHAIRLQHTGVGLANSLRGMGTGQQPSLWADLSRLDVPTLLVTGDRDVRYCEIASRMQAALPRSERQVIHAAGHTAHVDQPVEFARVVRAYLANWFSPRNGPSGSCRPAAPIDLIQS
jgi:2-succinyl-6-hydroxy-2,4-cyclohexadiene-1-carboxylate synthase